MQLSRQENAQFNPVIAHVEHIGSRIRASASALFVIQRGQVVTERYFGWHSPQAGTRPTQAKSQFNVASVRKSYIGFAVASALYQGNIQSIDDQVLDYLPELDRAVLDRTTLRHLLTHSHGLASDEQGHLLRRFPAGTSWEYRPENLLLLAAIVKRTTGKTIAHSLQEQVFAPLDFQETGWYTQIKAELVPVIIKPSEPPVEKLGESADGHQSNLFVSARELAYWGYLHLKKGCVNGQQIVPAHIFEWVTAVQSPTMADATLPQHGFLWWVKEASAERSEIGEQVPPGSYQVLGVTGATLLVIPAYDVVAVRMYNSMGLVEGYDYLRAVKDFGNIVASWAQVS